ncbi:glycosyltransferase [Polynucleobacter ibericus]|uniref:glycosyltransferase family protein n=1 Tax=Polynucleobacter ibericus TaxID=1819725 RepID=UPI001BFDB8DE|nr:glycosyltransferase [Polynucleobacter ibericus]QWE08965.1 glycosyltransferase family 1 protein [Polynucleobacter ibericus]
MKVIYSYNKEGFEAEYWGREIAAASSHACKFIPFNHGSYLNPYSYIRAQLLDNLYYSSDHRLSRMYAELEALIKSVGANVLIVDNCFPYHPEFLRRLPIYKVLRTSDGPLASYDRDFAYLHAYDHVLFHSPAYSKDIDMREKLRYCGAKNVDFWPLGSFEALCDLSKTPAKIFSSERDIDVVFIGALTPNKMPLLAKVKKAFGRRMRFHGLTNIKKNAYFNFKYGFPGWVRPIPFADYVPIYQRSKIGINVHNRGDYTVGGYRLFDLPANGVMQISDGGPYLNTFFEVGKEIESYRNTDELIDKIKYYLEHDAERQQIAQNGFRRVELDYRIAHLLQKAGEIIRARMEKVC